MAQATSIQFNTRIDGALKEAGDKVFALLGYTPSQAVRALWEYAVTHRDQPDKVGAILTDSSDDIPAAEAIQAKLAALSAGRNICMRLKPLSAEIANLSYEDLRATAYDERYAESL